MRPSAKAWDARDAALNGAAETISPTMAEALGASMAATQIQLDSARQAAGDEHKEACKHVLYDVLAAGVRGVTAADVAAGAKALHEIGAPDLRSASALFGERSLAELKDALSLPARVATALTATAGELKRRAETAQKDGENDNSSDFHAKMELYDMKLLPIPWRPDVACYKAMGKACTTQKTAIPIVDASRAPYTPAPSRGSWRHNAESEQEDATAEGRTAAAIAAAVAVQNRKAADPADGEYRRCAARPLETHVASVARVLAAAALHGGLGPQPTGIIFRYCAMISSLPVRARVAKVIAVRYDLRIRREVLAAYTALDQQDPAREGKKVVDNLTEVDESALMALMIAHPPPPIPTPTKRSAPDLDEDWTVHDSPPPKRFEETKKGKGKDKGKGKPTKGKEKGKKGGRRNDEKGKKGLDEGDQEF